MKLTYLIVVIALVVALVAPAYAQDGVDISLLPELLANALNISEFAGGLIVSMILCCFFLFPTILLTRRKAQGTLAVLIVGLGVLGICVALAWFPVWLLGVLCLLIALGFGGKVKDII